MTDSSDTPPPPPMVSLRLKREVTGIALYVNAKGLHDTLDNIGVGTSSGRYIDVPRSSYAVVNSGLRLSTDVFLTRQYPAKFNISACFSEPQPFSSYRTMLQSANEVVRRILEHYQPIDIKFDIQKKVIK